MAAEPWRASIAVVLLAAALCACAQARLPLPVPPERVALGRFSFLPPDEPGWLRGSTSAKSFVASRAAGANGEVYALHAYLEDLPPEAARQGLAEWLRGVAAKGRAPSPVFVAFDVQPAPEIAPSCARMVVRNTVHSTLGDVTPMFLSIVSFWCAHPRAPELGIMIGYAQQCEPRNEDPEIEQKAARLAGSLEFLDAP